ARVSSPSKWSTRRGVRTKSGSAGQPPSSAQGNCWLPDFRTASRHSTMEARSKRLIIGSNVHQQPKNRPGEKMKTLPLLAALPLLMAGASMPVTAQESTSTSCAQWLDHEVTKLNSSETIDICAETAGKPVVLVNTASYCGFTYQFTGLETLYQRFKDEGLVVIGFPSDDFNQEDDDAAATAEVCYINHGVTFL